jgi:hypothetical protein
MAFGSVSPFPSSSTSAERLLPVSVALLLRDGHRSQIIAMSRRGLPAKANKVSGGN